MEAELGLHGSMRRSNLFIENNLVKFNDHLTRANFSESKVLMWNVFIKLYKTFVVITA